MTDTHVYFLGSPLSQWALSRFSAQIDIEGPFYHFTHAEQYMMAAKAYLFSDEDSLQKILNASNPALQKSLGKRVKNFDPELWSKASLDVVIRANICKFAQNIDQRQFLISTGSRKIVEGNQDDPIWGVALDWNDDKILDEKNWRGENRLGQALEIVRDLFNNIPTTINPWTRKYI